jgi:hypothetical protein
MSTLTAQEQWRNYNLTPFQMARCEEIRAQPDFKQWVAVDPTKDTLRKRGPIVISFYTADGELNAHRLGVRRMICKVKTGRLP